MPCKGVSVSGGFVRPTNFIEAEVWVLWENTILVPPVWHLPHGWNMAAVGYAIPLIPKGAELEALIGRHWQMLPMDEQELSENAPRQEELEREREHLHRHLPAARRRRSRRRMSGSRSRRSSSRRPSHGGSRTVRCWRSSPATSMTRKTRPACHSPSHTRWPKPEERQEERPATSRYSTSATVMKDVKPDVEMKDGGTDISSGGRRRGGHDTSQTYL
jgi:hypothetical protein